MINKLLNPKILKIISIFVFLFFSFVFLFSRSFVGISFFGFRIGELSMLFSILSMVFFIFLNYKSNIYSKFVSSRFESVSVNRLSWRDRLHLLTLPSATILVGFFKSQFNVRQTLSA